MNLTSHYERARAHVEKIDIHKNVSVYLIVNGRFKLTLGRFFLRARLDSLAFSKLLSGAQRTAHLDLHLHLNFHSARHLGGYLSVYALTGDDLYKQRADELGQFFLPAFDTPSGLPQSGVYVGNGVIKPGGQHYVPIAEMATLQMVCAYSGGPCRHLTYVAFRSTSTLRTLQGTQSTSKRCSIALGLGVLCFLTTEI